MKKILIVSLFALFFILQVESKKHKWGRKVKALQNNGYRRRLKFNSDSLPYSSPLSRPYKWDMYSDGPYDWGPGKKKREINSFHNFKRTLYPQQQQRQPTSYQPAQQAAYYQPAQQPYQTAPQSYQPSPRSYQTAQSRNMIGQAFRNYRQPLILRKKAPQVQQPQERTWVDKMGVKWTTRKVNDYKWGEREPGITMDEYAGGPFGFDDVKRDEILRASDQHQWQRRSYIPRPNINPKRSWIDRNGVTWTTEHINDYKWGEREPGIAMDEYNGGPYGWNEVKRDKIFRPTRQNMYWDKP